MADVALKRAEDLATRAMALDIHRRPGGGSGIAAWPKPGTRASDPIARGRQRSDVIRIRPMATLRGSRLAQAPVTRGGCCGGPRRAHPTARDRPSTTDRLSKQALCRRPSPLRCRDPRLRRPTRACRAGDRCGPLVLVTLYHVNRQTSHTSAGVSSQAPSMQSAPASGAALPRIYSYNSKCLISDINLNCAATQQNTDGPGLHGFQLIKGWSRNRSITTA